MFCEFSPRNYVKHLRACFHKILHLSYIISDNAKKLNDLISIYLDTINVLEIYITNFVYRIVEKN